MYAMGLDIGGTKIEGVIITAEGSIISRVRTPTNREEGYESVLERIYKLCLDTIAQAQIKIDQLQGIGAGLPGTVHPQTGMMLNGNTQIFIDKTFKEDLKRKLNFSKDIFTENDANCFILAEAMFGAGKEYENEHKVEINSQTAIGIILGTGCGGGLIVNKNLIVGKNGGATEIGHITLVDDGHKCYCSRNGCAELYLSGKGIEENYFLETGIRAEAIDIFNTANGDNSPAKRIVDNYRQHLLKFLLNLASLYDPHYFVLGGGVSLQSKIYDQLESKLWKNNFIQMSKPRVYQHKLGDSSGVIGAASLGFIK